MAAAFSIKPLPGKTFGAVVEDFVVDAVIGATENDDAWDQLYEAWLEHALLILPQAFLTHSQQVALAKRFGPIELIGGREIVALSNVKPDGSLRGEDDMMKVLRGNMDWHCDSTYMELQATGAVFSADVVPSAGGNTGFADMRAAYKALDDQRKRQVEGLAAYHSLRYSQSAQGHTHTGDSDYVGYGMEHEGAPLRPLVKQHPVTGKPSLIIGRHAYGIPGMRPADSTNLLADLVRQACQGERVYEHQWTSGDAVIWDNRCLLHRARPWDMSEPRTMWHTRIAGNPKSEFAELILT